MNKSLVIGGLLTACLAVPLPGFAFKFGTVDASRLFNNYQETRKTKQVLEAEKAKLQEKLDGMKKELQDLDEQYGSTAKKLQDLRQAKKDAEAQKLEAQLRQLREKLAERQAAVQKFFESSQKQLYELEDEKMGALSKVLDTRVDDAIKRIAASKGLEAVFEKRFCYSGGEDITEAVLATLNAEGGLPGAAPGAAPKPAPAPAPGGAPRPAGQKPPK